MVGVTPGAKVAVGAGVGVGTGIGVAVGRTTPSGINTGNGVGVGVGWRDGTMDTEILLGPAIRTVATSPLPVSTPL